MFPPIVVTIVKVHLLCFQLKKRVLLNLVYKRRRVGYRILEYTVIPLLPNHPDGSKPNNFKEHISSSG